VAAGEELRGLRGPAEAVLRANDTGRYTVPSRATYPHQWNWDSALIALGWLEIDPSRAWTELETLMGTRDLWGMVPHIAFHSRTHAARFIDGPVRGLLTRVARPRPRYLPGPRWWGVRTGFDGRRISGITQPPLAASCARAIFERAPDEPRARALLVPLAQWHRFLMETRDPEGHGEPVLIHPWESGRDNAVEWDVPLWRVRPEVVAFHRRDTDSVDAAERPSDGHYARYLTLVRRGTARGWHQASLARIGVFRVLDPGFSAMLARAALDLSWLADALGEPGVASESRAMSDRLADALQARADADGLIRAVDLHDGSTMPEVSAGSALALLTPGLPEKGLAAARQVVLEGDLASPFGVRSLEHDHPELSPRNYWRGPVWANVTWLCAHALEIAGDSEGAGLLRARMLRAVSGGGMREYFVPDSGRGLGARDFAWTAALALHEQATVTA
jgi:Glycosyl hydrolase family 63 C-terminal domain